MYDACAYITLASYAFFYMQSGWLQVNCRQPKTTIWMLAIATETAEKSHKILSLKLQPKVVAIPTCGLNPRRSYIV